MKKLITGLCLVFSAWTAKAQISIKGYSLTEIGNYYYSANLNGGEKTDAQKMVDKLQTLGVNYISLSPRGIMTDPRGNDVIPKIIWDDPNNPRLATERNDYLNLIKYIKSKGMKVGIRPIFFVVDRNGNTPYVEKLPNGSNKIWWHGNIQPADPYRWFASFQSFLDRYMTIARVAKVDDFTIGAELYSMTVGIEDQWLAYPHGFPKEWNDILTKARNSLPSTTKVMYDINFTDDSINAGGVTELGGELARWKYRLVDLKDPNNIHWSNLAKFWKGLDAVGIDMYRSLAGKNDTVSANQEELTLHLKKAASQYALQLDDTMFAIEDAVEAPQKIVLKEIGFRSVEKGFIEPFAYADGGRGNLNIMHQAASYDAIFRAFWTPNWSWFDGIVFWDVSVSPNLHGANDTGFSPIGKTATETVIKTYYK